MKKINTLNNIYNKLFSAIILLVLALSIPTFIYVSPALADRAEDYCNELIGTIENSEDAGSYANCVQSARNAETTCGTTNGVGNDGWQQCIDNYYGGLRGTSDPVNNSDEPIETDCEPEPPGSALTRENCGIINLLVIGINILSALAGMAIVFSMMFAGYLYMTSRDNSGQVQKAKQRIVWSLTALVLFIFMYALLNFLVPGGVI
jgi:hypothetical protein